MVDDTTGNHETRVQGTTGNTSQRMPCTVIKPVPKLVKSICNEVLGRSEVEPRVDCVWLATLNCATLFAEGSFGMRKLTFVDNTFES